MIESAKPLRLIKEAITVKAIKSINTWLGIGLAFDVGLLFILGDYLSELYLKTIYKLLFKLFNYDMIIF